MNPDKALPKLSDRAEALLQNWSVAERDWEADAKAIESKLAAVAPGSTDPALLEPPLPREAGEGEIRAEAVPAPAPSEKPQSLAELARASVRRNSDASDAKELAKETLAVASMRRGPSAELVERVQAAAARGASATQTPVASIAEPGKDEAPRVSGVVSRAPVARRTNTAALYGAGAALLGLAAAVAIFVGTRGSQRAEQALVAAPTTAEVSPQSPAPEPAAKPAEAPPRGVADLAPSPAPEQAPAPSPAAAPLTTESATEKSVAKAAPAPAPSGASSVAAAPAPENIVLEEDPAPAAPAPPAEAPASDPSAKAEAQLRPADGTAGGVAQKPSIGAVQAAVGSVMGPARSCLAGQSEPSRAQIVFGSDGSVQSVSVSGPAAGTPAGACIESALKKARMQPFAIPTFSTSVTIRPP